MYNARTGTLETMSVTSALAVATNADDHKTAELIEAYQVLSDSNIDSYRSMRVNITRELSNRNW